MFTILSGPAIAAISVVIGNHEQDEVIKTCIEGLMNVASIAAYYHWNGILDELVVSLCKLSSLLEPISAEESVVALVEDSKVRLATTSVFSIANRYGTAFTLAGETLSIVCYTCTSLVFFSLLMV